MSRRLIWMSLLAVLAPTACQLGTVGVQKHVALPKANPSQAVAAISAQPSTRLASTVSVPTHSPNGVPSPSPSQAQAPQMMLAPASPTSVVDMTVAVDASYVVSSNTGNIISNNGSSVLAAGNGHLDPGGASLISDHGGAVIATNSGNIISNNGAGILSNNGGGILSNNGGGILSNNGGGIVSNNGSSLTAKPGSGKAFKLTSTTSPVYGQVLTAAGMNVHVRSLSTGLPVPIGVDGAGQPVYAAYSNLGGAVRLYLPAAEVGNVLIQADVPDTADERQRYKLLASTLASKPAALDEETAQVTRYARLAFASQFQAIMLDDPAHTIASIGALKSFPDAVKPALLAVAAEIRNAATAAGVTSDATRAAAVRALAFRAGDAILARTDLAAIVLSHQSYPDWGTQPEDTAEPAIAAMAKVMKALREAATVKMTADALFFDHQPYFQAANACKPGFYVIKRPSDINDFVVSEYLSAYQIGGTSRVRPVLDSVGVVRDPVDHVEQGRRSSAAVYAIAATLAQAVFTNKDGAKDATLALIKAFDPNRSLSAEDAAIPPFPALCPYLPLAPSATPAI